MYIYIYIHETEQLRARGHYAISSATLLLQLHFNSFPDAHLVPDEVTLCNTEKVPSSIWCDLIRDNMSIRAGVDVHLQQYSCTLKPHSDPEPLGYDFMKAFVNQYLLLY